MNDLTITAKIGEPVELGDCPEGLALFNTTMILVTSYGFARAYVVATGDILLGEETSEEERNRLIVRPVILVAGSWRFS